MSVPPSINIIMEKHARFEYCIRILVSLISFDSIESNKETTHPNSNIENNHSEVEGADGNCFQDIIRVIYFEMLLDCV